MSYIDGFLTAVPEANKEKFRAQARRAWEKAFRPHGALEQVECWGDDVPEGKLTSMPMAVKLEPGEVVVFSYIIWPDKATRDAAYKTMPMDSDELPFDGKRMIWGGFVPVVSEKA